VTLFRKAPRAPFPHQLSGHHGHTEVHWGLRCTVCETWTHAHIDQMLGRKLIHCFGCGREARQALMTRAELADALDDREFRSRGKRRAS